MSGVAVQTKQEEWCSRELAAKRVGVSVRTLRKIAQAGRIRRKHIPPAPGRPYQSVVYNVADLDAYKSAAVDGSSALLAVPSVHAAAPAAAVPVALALLAERLAVPPRVRRWLTLAEAVEYSGLPRAFLLLCARRGDPMALNVGTEARPRWRFDRDKL